MLYSPKSWINCYRRIRRQKPRPRFTWIIQKGLPYWTSWLEEDFKRLKFSRMVEPQVAHLQGWIRKFGLIRPQVVTMLFPLDQIVVLPVEHNLQDLQWCPSTLRAVLLVHLRYHFHPLQKIFSASLILSLLTFVRIQSCKFQFKSFKEFFLNYIKTFKIGSTSCWKFKIPIIQKLSYWMQHFNLECLNFKK